MKKAFSLLLSIFLLLNLGFSVVNAIEKARDQKSFLTIVNSRLCEMQYQINKILQFKNSPENIEKHSILLQQTIAEFETITECGRVFVSEQIHCIGPSQGFSDVDKALNGQLGTEYSGNSFALNGLSYDEELFLNMLLDAINTLIQSFDLTAKYPSEELKKYMDSFWTFEQEWQLESFRAPTGTSPYDVLKRTSN